MHNIKFSIIALLSLYMHTALYSFEPIILNTFYGTTTITEPVLIELIQSDAMQRLTNINQYGIMKFIKPDEEYTRYQHSIAVLYLLRRFGASLEEQVMGLLHDVSHTAFSHVADFLFNTVQNKCSFQDSIFAWYVEQTDLKPILEKYDLLWICDTEKQEAFIMLKDAIPNLCADRLEYNLYGGYLEGLLTQDEINKILNTLCYTDGKWLFHDSNMAHLFAHVTLKLSTDIWCADWNCFIYSEAATLLKRACDLEIITIDELKFSYDVVIWDKLINHNDSIIQQQIYRILHYTTEFTHGTLDDHDYVTQGKFRWIDPFIKTETGIKQLSSIDETFNNHVIIMKKQFIKPHYIKYATLVDSNVHDKSLIGAVAKKSR